MIEVKLKVNGREVEDRVEPRKHLGDFLRENAQLTGTNLSCEHGVCGACTVLVDGRPVRSCITFAGACQDAEVTTIEGYEGDPIMGRLREAFTANHALQCGFCTPGMLTTSRDIVLRLPDADEKRVRIELAGNICRCTGYQGITNAVLSVLKDLQDNPDEQVESMRAAAKRGEVVQVTSAAFEGFAAKKVSAPAPAKASEPKAAPAKNDAVNKGSTITGEFEVAHPAAAVWEFMSDLKAVAACLPGAVVEEQEGDRVKGRVAIKFGPMSAAFKGSAILNRDDANHEATLQGEGIDTLSQSRARGDVSYKLNPVSADSTRVDVSLVYSLQGPLAQFSRSGLVQDFVRRLIKDFGKNVEARIGGGEDAASMPAASMNPFKMMISIYWEKLMNMFKKK
ncbi:MAG TPA: 2Fe-2S iron-sulfur cluster-binding protein [Paenalcaligenes sp.]|nr:2Fe-2S iron-sulfur cluster-binding protein [Paenalcaligenes sp.]